MSTADEPLAAAESRSFGFQDLVRHRVNDVLLVASPYESFILAEDGQPQALMLSEFLGLNIQHVPGFRHVPTGAAALAVARRRPRPSLIIASMHVGDMDAAALGRRLDEAGIHIPLVLLAYDGRELAEFSRHGDVAFVDRAFLWQGDARIFPAIVKYVEDRLNVFHDTGRMGVQAILVVEDSVKHYSSFLPAIYAEVMAQSRRLIPEGLNLAHKLLRFQARPKILLSATFEEAERYFRDYQENVLGIISDIEFPLAGKLCPDAGVRFARMVRSLEPDLPIILQSAAPEHRAAAEGVDASFLLKGSPLMLQTLSAFMSEYFSFGDFVFRLPDGGEVGRAHDLKTLEEQLHAVPAESLGFHARRHHFSRWLKARTEFAVAQRLRQRKISDFATLEDLRHTLIRSIQEYRRERGRATVSDFDPASYDADVAFARLKGGSLGGKARGLAFVNLLLGEYGIRDRFPGVRVAVPSTLVLATDVFDGFLREEGLGDLVVAGADDQEIRRRVLGAPFPRAIEADLRSFLRVVREPLAVRSSSLLEDSMFQPFAGIYDTHMIGNDHPDLEFRLRHLLETVKLVFASTFARRARTYLEATGNRLEEEKMAVIVQRVVGARHGSRFYPDFAGVARSHNFYPIAPMRAEDGIAAVALGFGEAVVDGEACLRFCPRYPQSVVQFSAVDDVLRNSQRSFHALELRRPEDPRGAGFDLVRFGLEAAEADGTLAAVGSTYSRENDVVYDGVSRPGVRLVSFAPVLKHGLFPLAAVLDTLLKIGVEGMGGPVEIEFAVNLWPARGAPREFGFLQLRPLALARESADLPVDELAPERVLCRSGSVLGHGRSEDIRDIVVVDVHRFERGKSTVVAGDVARFNAALVADRTPYLLIGVGRWGSREPLLGIPVGWDQIAGARVIVEAGFKDFRVAPSQGTHFFQNLTAASVGYFTVNPEAGEGFVDWAWLAAQPAVAETEFVRHLRLARPVLVEMDGRKNQGVIAKPSDA